MADTSSLMVLSEAMLLKQQWRKESSGDQDDLRSCQGIHEENLHDLQIPYVGRTSDVRWRAPQDRDDNESLHDRLVNRTLHVCDLPPHVLYPSLCGRQILVARQGQKALTCYDVQSRAQDIQTLARIRSNRQPHRDALEVAQVLNLLFGSTDHRRWLEVADGPMESHQPLPKVVACREIDDAFRDGGVHEEMEDHVGKAIDPDA